MEVFPMKNGNRLGKKQRSKPLPRPHVERASRCYIFLPGLPDASPEAGEGKIPEKYPESEKPVKRA
jgi:hypothetical protein